MQLATANFLVASCPLNSRLWDVLYYECLDYALFSLQIFQLELPKDIPFIFAPYNIHTRTVYYVFYSSFDIKIFGE